MPQEVKPFHGAGSTFSYLTDHAPGDGFVSVTQRLGRRLDVGGRFEAQRLESIFSSICDFDRMRINQFVTFCSCQQTKEAKKQSSTKNLRLFVYTYLKWGRLSVIQAPELMFNMSIGGGKLRSNQGWRSPIEEWELHFRSCVLRSPLKSKVYKHKQHSGDWGRGQFENVDNHHSPVQPELYIEYRMLERMAWYQKRIPRYTFHSFAFKVLLLTCAWVKTADVFLALMHVEESLLWAVAPAHVKSDSSASICECFWKCTFWFNPCARWSNLSKIWGESHPGQSSPSNKLHWVGALRPL